MQSWVAVATIVERPETKSFDNGGSKTVVRVLVTETYPGRDGGMVESKLYVTVDGAGSANQALLNALPGEIWALKGKLKSFKTRDGGRGFGVTVLEAHRITGAGATSAEPSRPAYAGDPLGREPNPPASHPYGPSGYDDDEVPF